jgi:hypothetical protein
MPFRSKRQWRLCWALHNRAVAAHRVPRWDCAAFAAVSPPYNTLPEYTSTGPGHRYRLIPVHTGARGVRYIIKNGKKVYLNKLAPV